MRLVVAAVAILLALALPLVLLPVLVVGTITRQPDAIATAALPPLAAAELDTIAQTTATACPELPPVWVIAHVQAESGWDPSAFSDDTNGGAAGLYQMNETNWRAAGGAAWTSTPPAAGADVLQPVTHLRLAIPWVCANLRSVAAHLRATGKPILPLDAMLVCHIAGCGRVTGSRSGVPGPGEAGCDTACSGLVHRYLDRVHTFVKQYGGGPRAPAAPDDRGTGCTSPDPTGGRCITPTTRHAYDEIVRAFGPPGPGSALRSAGCWDAHAWNPTSDHPRGRACDFFPAAAGQRPQGEELRVGWRLANWLRSNAGTLGVSYIIWQGRIWSPGDADEKGWGRPYGGGGVYDPDDVTGGHYDHIHVSIRR